MSTKQSGLRPTTDAEFFRQLANLEFDVYRDVVRAVDKLGWDTPGWMTPLFNAERYTKYIDRKGWIRRTPEGRYTIVVPEG